MASSSVSVDLVTLSDSDETADDDQDVCNDASTSVSCHRPNDDCKLSLSSSGDVGDCVAPGIASAPGDAAADDEIGRLTAPPLARSEASTAGSAAGAVAAVTDESSASPATQQSETVAKEIAESETATTDKAETVITQQAEMAQLKQSETVMLKEAEPMMAMEAETSVVTEAEVSVAKEEETTVSDEAEMVPDTALALAGHWWRRCVNRKCTSRLRRRLVPAHAADLAYYGALYGAARVPAQLRQQGRRVKICTACRSLVDRYTQTMLDAVSIGRPLLECAVDQVEEEVTLDSDSSSDANCSPTHSDGDLSSCSDESMVSLPSADSVDLCISRAMETVNFDSQLDSCLGWLHDKVKCVEDSFSRTERELIELEKHASYLYEDLYRNRPPTRSVSPLELIQIDADCLLVSQHGRTLLHTGQQQQQPEQQVSRTDSYSDPTAAAGSASDGGAAAAAAAGDDGAAADDSTVPAADMQLCASDNQADTSADSVADITISDVIHSERDVGEPADLPPVGAVQRVAPLPGQLVCALFGGAWLCARLADVIVRQGVSSYVVIVNGKRLVLTGNKVAYCDAPPVRLAVGERVVCVLNGDSATRSSCHSGTVGEAPKAVNSFRYLVFFDTGASRYVRHKDVRLIHAPSANILHDIPEPSRVFIAHYLAEYPERALVRLQAGQQVKMKYLGQWVVARVAEVDATLARMVVITSTSSANASTPPPHTPTHHSLWLYRGSARLAPIFNQLTSRQQPRRLGTGARRHILNTVNMGKKNRVFVEYNRADTSDSGAVSVMAPVSGGADAKPPPHPLSRATPPSAASTAPQQQQQLPRAVARKSTSSSSVTLPATPPAASVLPPPAVSASVALATVNVSQEGEGQIREISPRPTVVPRRLRPHTCSRHCVPVNSSIDQLKGQNPLLMPMLCGWIREIVLYRASRRTVMYRAPCGRRLRSISEVHAYLALTACALHVDCFCFDYWVHCFTEFEPAKKFCAIKDISYGKEYVPVSCVNSLDRDFPAFVEYSTERLPTPGVALNLDADFLFCCDCTDDCQDKERCACWQETVKSSAFGPSGRVEPDTGYHYRRLLQGNVITAIYECNSRCKCRQSCLNRVVQHPLRLRMQVFKTLRRGWGIRCLDDIPKGGFICVYVGQLLNEATANEDGKTYGDEYLAELDFIEVLEQLKEGYESDVVEEADDDDDSDSTDHPNSADDVQLVFDTENGEDTVPHDSDPKDNDFKPHSGKHTIPGQLRRSNRARPVKQTGAASSGDGCDALRNKPLKRTSSATATASSSAANSDSEQQATKKKMADSKTTTDKQKELPASLLQKLPDSDYHSVRQHFGTDEYCYIMDAKNIGNIGRYLNHSCSPNVFVQNVFVDTQDLRSPWVAFFALTYIRAGTELTWDYSYEVGSVPGKVMYCQCGSDQCRGRLL